jgi:hypothetical protein
LIWFVYVRPGGLLFDVENKPAARKPSPPNKDEHDEQWIA